jgi:hypothetical protein
MNIQTQKFTHSDRLERWLGTDAVEQVSKSMADWYGPPIALQGVPGAVFATKGGEFVGHVDAGQFGSAYDRAEDAVRRAARNGQRVLAGWTAKQLVTANAGFSSLSDLIAEATAGKKRDIIWQKVGPTGVANVTSSLWRVGNQPAAGAAGSAAPGGRAPTGATTGAVFGLDNVSTDTRHFVSASVVSSVAGNTLLMYDRIFDVAKTMNSTATEAVTGVPSRYQSSTSTNADYAGGNFLFVEVGGTALAATAHNWTTCLYRNQAGTGNQTLPSLTGNSGAIVDRLDHPTNSWFAPLASGDTGVMDLAQMQCSALVATGAVNFVIGHPLAWLPCPIANLACQVDGINTAFNLVRVFDNAAISFLEISKPSATATTYNGFATFIHG